MRVSAVTVGQIVVQLREQVKMGRPGRKHQPYMRQTGVTSRLLTHPWYTLLLHVQSNLGFTFVSTSVRPKSSGSDKRCIERAEAND